jgi:hypothetical protein
VQLGSPEWAKLWNSFAGRYFDPAWDASDRLMLYVGEGPGRLDELKEAAARARQARDACAPQKLHAQAEDARARRGWTWEGKGSRIARCSTSFAT